MIFHGTKLPDSVSIALEKGNLVIFVGAGVSTPSPSDLPLFDDLVVQIGKQFGINIEKEKVQGKEDRKLGEWKETGHDVHNAARSILKSESSKPTELHRELLKIFKSSKCVRIVTTNVDNHFFDAIKEIYPDDEIEEYHAPALPLGDDFSGVVYLHGSVRKNSKKMVLTTEDFGKAYFTQGWAREFLLNMFSKYTVLFVGYSHGDVLVSYLSYGLKHVGINPRYSLISSNSSDDDKVNWNHLGIQTEEYLIDNNHPDNSHHLLTKFFSEWSAFVNESILDQANRLKLTVKKDIQVDDAIAEYIDHRIQNPRHAQVICNSIEDEGRIKWMHERDYFKRFFHNSEDANKKLNPSERIIAQWLCSFVRTKYPELLLEIIREHNQTFNCEFAEIFASTLCSKSDEYVDSRFNIWVNLLFNNGPKKIPLMIWFRLLGNCDLSKDTGLTLKLLDFVTTPSVNLIKPYPNGFNKDLRDTQQVEFEINWLDEFGDKLKKVWEEIFRPAIPEIGDELLALVVKQITYAKLHLQSIGVTWNSLSRLRTSIASHEDEHTRGHECLNVLIDIARDVMEHWVETNVIKARYHISIWADSKVYLLRRLAIHGIGMDSSMSGDYRIKWLLDNNLIYEDESKREVFAVLKSSYQLTSTEVRQSLIDRIKEGIKKENLDDQVIAYEKHIILIRLKKYDESCKLIQAGLEEIYQEYPYLSKPEYSESDLSISKVEHFDPSQDIDIEKILSESPSSYIDNILNPERNSFFGICRVHSGNFKKLFENRDWSKQFMKDLALKKIFDSEIWGSIFYAWREIIKLKEDWEWILNEIESLPKEKEIYSSASNLISNRFWLEETDISNDTIERGYLVISKTWELCKDDNPEHEIESERLLDNAVNHVGGYIGEFWIHYASHLRKRDEDTWIGIPEKLKKQMIQAIQGTGKTASYARFAITPWISYLFAWDEEFAKSHLIPLFDWDRDSVIAQQTWSVFTDYRRLTLVEMEELLIPHYIQLANHLGDGGDWLENLSKNNSLHRLGIYIAELLMQIIPDPMQSGHISKFVSKLPDDVLSSLAIGMGNHLKGLKPEEQKEKWDLWIKKYLENRLIGIPTTFSSNESNHIAEWCLHLNDLFPESVELLAKMPLKNVFAYSMIKEMLGSHLLGKYPKEACQFCNLIMKKEEDYPHLHDHLLGLLTQFDLLICGTDELIQFKEALYKRGWSPDEKNNNG